MKTGIYTTKLGMSTYFEGGQAIPVTLLEVAPNVVTEIDEEAGRITVGFFNASRRQAKPQKGYYAKHKIEAKNKLAEFIVSSTEGLEVGKEIPAETFEEGQLVDTTSVCKGKGFAGGMKRWNFKGLEASHGISVSHRSHGSTGQCQDPGKVFKGKKMAGQYGNVQKTTQNLKIVKIEAANENEPAVIFVKGAVPGAKGAEVLIREAVKQINKK